MKTKKLGVAIEGGGAAGAFTIGRLMELNRDYDMGSGVSTGALMLLLVLHKEFDLLAEAYTSVQTKDITEVSAFNRKGHLDALTLAWRIARRKRTIGKSENLRRLIDKFITEELFFRTRESGKEALVSAYSLSYKEVAHFSSNDFTNPHDFKDFVWASANAGPFMSILQKARPRTQLDIEEWSDGGITDGQTAAQLFEHGCHEVDLFLHSPLPKRTKEKNIQNILHFIMRWKDAQDKERKENDLTQAINAAIVAKGILRVHYLPMELASNYLVFDKRKMKLWLEMGKSLADDPTYQVEYNFE